MLKVIWAAGEAASPYAPFSEEGRFMAENDQKILTPPGYGKLVPLDRNKHKGMGVNATRGLGAGLNSIFVTFPEFFMASKSFPLVFVRLDLAAAPESADGGKEEKKKKKKSKKSEAPESKGEVFLPIVITGLKEGENRFVNAIGKWAPKVYVPAYARLYPFYVINARSQEGQEPERLICVDESGLSSEGAPLFNEDGSDAEPWTQAQTLINEMEKARGVTSEFCQSLQELELFESFEVKLNMEGKQGFELKNFYRVDEKKLNELSGDQLKGLMEKGALARVYAHLLSLDNFRTIMELPETPNF